MENTNKTATIEEKKSQQKDGVKSRTNVNVSLRKRDRQLLNDILNLWEADNCNLSSEVCDAIILKNLSNTNPHIQTILSTLSLIESSLKSHYMTKKMESEEIRRYALSIFNEVITIDIDGNKLTNLIKGVGLNKDMIKSSEENRYQRQEKVEEKKIEDKKIENSNPIKTSSASEEPVTQEPKYEDVSDEQVVDAEDDELALDIANEYDSQEIINENNEENDNSINNHENVQQEETYSEDDDIGRFDQIANAISRSATGFQGF